MVDPPHREIQETNGKTHFQVPLFGQILESLNVVTSFLVDA